MKIVIVGYGEMFQALISSVLKTEHKIVGVFRHENVIYSPFKRFFNDVFRPSSDFNFVKNLYLHDINAKSVNSDKFRNEIKKLDVDLIIVGSWSEKFSPETINCPKLACVNTHPSLLPKYRGPNPYLQTILNNEPMTGVTFHLMGEKFDDGDILHQTAVKILDSDTGASLRLRCCDCAKKELRVLLNNFEDRLKNPMKQDISSASYQSHIKLAECILNFEKESTKQIDRRIRALTPWLNCVIPYEEEFFEFEKYEISDKISDKAPAEIIDKSAKSLSIVCNDKKVIKFYNMKMKSTFSKLLTKIYINLFVKVGKKAI